MKEIEIVGVAIFLLIVLIRTLYYIVVYGAPVRLSRRVKKGNIKYVNQQDPVSVIVYSKFGYEDIEPLIPKLCLQDYPTFQVIFVLNEEHKFSIQVEERLKETYSNLYFTYYPDKTQVQSRYKLALSIGLKAAKYNCILLTQSHCAPVSTHWIAMMARNRVAGIDIIVGMTRYTDTRKSQRTLDAWIGNTLRIRAYSLSSMKAPYMSFGSNLMFTKSLYLQDRHIKSNLRLLHGEDNLFVNQCATSSNTRMELDEASMTEANVCDKSWITHQFPSIYLDLRRYYQGAKHRIFHIEQIVNILFIASLILCGCLFYNNYWGIGVLVVAMLALLIELLIIRRNAQKTHQTNYVFIGLLYRIIAPVLFKVQGKYKHKRTRYE